MKKVYGDKVRVIWKNFPLNSIHKNATPAALASLAANEQGKFWEYHDKLFANQGKLARENLLQYARELNLDMKRFEEAFDSAKLKASVEADTAEAGALGLTGTPALFVNGRFLGGAKPYEEVAKLINAELTKLNIPIPPAAANVGG